MLLVASIAGEFLLNYLGVTASSTSVNLFNGVSVYNFTSYSSFFIAGVCAWKYRERLSVNFGGFILALIIMLAARESTLSTLAVKICLPYIIIYLGTCGGVGSRITRKVGDLSYGVYLFAYPVTNSIVSLTGQRLSGGSVFVIGLVFILPLAWLSWHLIEARCLSLKRLLPAHDLNTSGRMSDQPAGRLPSIYEKK